MTARGEARAAPAAAPQPAAAPPPSTGSVVSVGSIITVAFMGSVVVTPLYTLYQRKFGFSAIVLTMIYAVYVA